MKVLICEDDVVVLKAIQVAVENEKSQAICLQDGGKALQYLKDHEVDLIITDIHMPYHNGDEILKLVRDDQRRNTPIVMISSDTEEEVIKLALKLGVDEFIEKPIDTSKLQRKLRKYLRATS
jgi:DNA-binding response OmpR family regulator